MKTLDASQIDDQLKAIFQRLFGVGADQLNDQLRRNGLQRWDSLGHLELLASLEKEFRVEIPLTEVLAMETVGDVKRVVAGLCQQSSLKSR